MRCPVHDPVILKSPVRQENICSPPALWRHFSCLYLTVTDLNWCHGKRTESRRSIVAWQKSVFVASEWTENFLIIMSLLFWVHFHTCSHSWRPYNFVAHEACSNNDSTYSLLVLHSLWNVSSVQDSPFPAVTRTNQGGLGRICSYDLEKISLQVAPDHCYLLPSCFEVRAGQGQTLLPERTSASTSHSVLLHFGVTPAVVFWQHWSATSMAYDKNGWEKRSSAWIQGNKTFKGMFKTIFSQVNCHMKLPLLATFQLIKVT